jgi:hypothetical protein
MLIGYITVRSPRKMKLFLNELPSDCIANYNGAMNYADGNLIAQNNIPYSEAINFIERVLQEAPNIIFVCAGICSNPVSRLRNPLIFNGFFVVLVCALLFCMFLLLFYIASFMILRFSYSELLSFPPLRSVYYIVYDTFHISFHIDGCFWKISFIYIIQYGIMI